MNAVDWYGTALSIVDYLGFDPSYVEILHNNTVIDAMGRMLLNIVIRSLGKSIVEIFPNSAIFEQLRDGGGTIQFNSWSEETLHLTGCNYADSFGVMAGNMISNSQACSTLVKLGNMFSCQTAGNTLFIEGLEIGAYYFTLTAICGAGLNRGTYNLPSFNPTTGHTDCVPFIVVPDSSTVSCQACSRTYLTKVTNTTNFANITMPTGIGGAVVAYKLYMFPFRDAQDW